MENLDNIVNNNINNEVNLDLKNMQNYFLESNIGKIINTAVNVGLRFVLPDLVENEIIKIKDTIMEEGLKEGIKTVVSEGINFGKSAIGIVTGKFENVNQMQNAIKKGGIIDNISKLIDLAVNKGNEKGKISDTTANMITKGKKILLDNITSNIESMMENQVNLVENLSKYSKQWNSCFENKDFFGMEKEYKKIKTILNKIVPLETTINEGKKIENLHNLIKNNGQNFNLSEEELKLASVL